MALLKLMPRPSRQRFRGNICEQCLWVQKGTPDGEAHYEGRLGEAFIFVEKYRYSGMKRRAREEIPRFCTFCLHDGNLAASARIGTYDIIHALNVTWDKHLRKPFDQQNG
jgi:hypothetical protein